MKSLLAIFLINLVLGCSAFDASEPIPRGLYYGPEKTESVRVDGDGLTFRIYAPKLLDGSVVTRGPYTFEMKASGEIRINASSNDSVFLLEIDRCRWVWNGKGIIREDPSGMNRPTFFTRPEANR